jgi:hypothetical protein
MVGDQLSVVSDPAADDPRWLKMEKSSLVLSFKKEQFFSFF